MKKKFQKKSSRKVGTEKEELRDLAKVLLEQGDLLGDTLTGIVAQVADSWEGTVVATVGLAKATAVLRGLYELHDQDFNKLFDLQLASYQQTVDEIIADIKSEKK